MANIQISQLPPAPPETGSATPLGTDLTPATDITNISTPTGQTNKYARWAEFNFYMSAQGFITFDAARVATTSGLTATYSNGTLGVGATLTNSGTQAALSIDSVAVAVGDRILVAMQASPAQNGIYVVSNVGSASSNWVLTRANDYDMAADVAQNDLILVNQGSTYAGKSFVQTNTGPFVIGTTSIIFSLYSVPSSSSSFKWNVETSSAAMSSNNGYITNSSGLVSLSLPFTSSIGDAIAVSGQGTGGWTITQIAGQQIFIGNASTTLGIGGSLSSTNQYDSLRLVCIVANYMWTTTGGVQGNLSYV